MRGALHGPLPRDLAGDRGELLVLQARARSAINDAYWAFSRQARGPLVSPELYERAKWIEEALRRLR